MLLNLSKNANLGSIFYVKSVNKVIVVSNILILYIFLIEDRNIIIKYKYIVLDKDKMIYMYAKYRIMCANTQNEYEILLIVYN